MAIQSATSNAQQTDTTSEPWEKLCAELTAERDQLRLEAITLREKRDQYRKMVGILMFPQEAEFDEDELLVQAGKGQSLSEFVAELEAKLKAEGAL